MAKPPMRRRRQGKALARLPLGVRVALMVIGWALVAIGIAGLILPGIQGILTLLLGAAVLSLVSQRVHNGLRRLFRRWPKGWRRLEKLRRKLHRKLSPKND